MNREFGIFSPFLLHIKEFAQHDIIFSVCLFNVHKFLFCQFQFNVQEYKYNWFRRYMSIDAAFTRLTDNIYVTVRNEFIHSHCHPICTTSRCIFQLCYQCQHPIIIKISQVIVNMGCRKSQIRINQRAKTRVRIRGVKNVVKVKLVAAAALIIKHILENVLSVTIYVDMPLICNLNFSI